MRSLKIRKLQAQNFRNLHNNIISFSPGINCILGENGNGKTNILEAIYILIMRKSFRKNASFPQYLGIDGENPEIYISAAFEEKDEELVPCSGKIWQGGSEWYLEGKPTKKKPQVGIIFINPFDSQTFHTTASVRRSWVDTHLSQLDSVYKKNLSKYSGSLKFRNSLLFKKPSRFREQIKAIDSEMASLAVSLTIRRRHFLKELEPFTEKTFKEIFGEEHRLTMNLDSRVVDANPQKYLQILAENFSKDEAIGHTSYGVHRDDYVLLFNGLNSFDYCSLGQQKMSYLSLLFAYIELFRYKFTSFPIVLLDDVSGELDKVRWTRLVNYLERSSFQILITTANEKFEEELGRIEGANKILVQLGATSQL